MAEVWFYPDGSRILELSTKCAPSETFAVAAETRAYLISQGVSLAGEQQTKTKTALEFYRGGAGCGRGGRLGGLTTSITGGPARRP